MPAAFWAYWWLVNSAVELGYMGTAYDLSFDDRMDAGDLRGIVLRATSLSWV